MTLALDNQTKIDMPLYQPTNQTIFALEKLLLH